MVDAKYSLSTENNHITRVFSSYKLILAVLLLLFSSSGAARLDCQGSVHISPDGDTTNQLDVSISPPEGYYYPSDSEFGFSLPKNSEIKSVSDKNQELNFESRTTANLYKRINVTTSERIEDSENYAINIEYNVKHGSVIYGDKALLRQILPTSSCSTPSDVKIQYPNNWQFNKSEHEKYTLEGKKIAFRSYNRSKPVQVWFKVNNSSSELITYQSGVLNVTVPKLYENKISRQTQIADNLLPEIEEKTGIESPGGFQIKYLPLKSSKIGEEVAGQYYGGKIQIASTQLAYTEEYGLETLLHELVHGYSEKISENSPDWWWEEGIANYVTHSIMKESGYDTSTFEPSERAINETFEHCSYSRDFISDWSPVDETGTIISVAYPCNGKKSVKADGERIDLITDKDRLGYQYSELIITQIFNNTEQDVSSVYTLMQRSNVSFSNTRELMNNQINFFGSKVTDKNLTKFLRGKGIDTDSWNTKYSKLEKTENKLDKIDSTYSFTNATKLRQDLERVRNKFYKGHFSTSNVDNVIKQVEERNKTLNEIREKHEKVRENINKLESSESPGFYKNDKKELETALNLARQLRFEESKEKLTEINNSAFNKNERIQKYQKKANKTELMIENKPLVVKPFMLSAKQDLIDSRASFNQNKLETARDQLEDSKSKLKIAPMLASITYSILIAAAYILTTRYRTK